MTTKTDETPRVWVGCLACYNAGHLVGEWVDADEAGDFVPCRRTEYGSPHEEWWCMDHEGFGAWLSGECSPMEAQRIAETIAAIRADGVNPDAVAAWSGDVGPDVDEWDAPTSDAFSDAYFGEWDSFKDYAEDFADQTGAVPDDAVWPLTHIDWDSAADELEQEYHVVDNPAGGVFVFSAH